MYFEEFKVGQKFRLEPVSIKQEELHEFALKYDPQPLHLDEDFANNGIFQGIIASGYQTLCVIWRKFIDLNLFGTEIIGGTGIDNLRWTAPVYPDEQLLTEIEIIEVTSNRKGQGFIVSKFDTRKENGKPVFTMQVRQIIKSRAE